MLLTSELRRDLQLLRSIYNFYRISGMNQRRIGLGNFKRRLCDFALEEKITQAARTELQNQ